MSKSSGQTESKLESLCLDMAALGAESGGPEKGCAESLEALLRDRPELQDAYCRQVLLDLLLKSESSDANDSQPLVNWPAESDKRDSPQPAESVQLANPQRTSVSAFVFHRLNRFAIASCIAATLVVFCVGSLQYWRADSGGSQFDSSGPGLTLKQMELRNQDVTRLLYHVSNTPWDNEVAYSTAEMKKVTTYLSQGIAGLGKFNNKDAGGYIVALPPGAVLNLTVHADAVGENALSVIGLDRQGQTTGEVVSFSNQANSASPENGSTIYGRIGIWSEFNDSSVTKFYLLTGLHHMLTESGSMDWQVTDFQAFLELPHLIHIGWDDTDWTPKTLGAMPPDKDYDDITVTVRIDGVDRDETSLSNTVLTYPEKEQDAGQLKSQSPKKEYPITVLPGEGAILTVSSKAHYESELAVIERDSRRVWWRRQNKSGEESHLGVYVIENYSAEPIDFLLIGRHRVDDADQDAPWHASSYQKRLDDDVSRRDHCQMIGFEDFGGEVDDFNDIRVNIHWSNLRIAE